MPMHQYIRCCEHISEASTAGQAAALVDVALQQTVCLGGRTLLPRSRADESGWRVQTFWPLSCVTLDGMVERLVPGWLLRPLGSSDAVRTEMADSDNPECCSF